MICLCRYNTLQAYTFHNPQFHTHINTTSIQNDCFVHCCFLWHGSFFASPSYFCFSFSSHRVSQSQSYWTRRKKQHTTAITNANPSKMSIEWASWACDGCPIYTKSITYLWWISPFSHAYHCVTIKLSQRNQELYKTLKRKKNKRVKNLFEKDWIFHWHRYWYWFWRLLIHRVHAQTRSPSTQWFSTIPLSSGCSCLLCICRRMHSIFLLLLCFIHHHGVKPIFTTY